MNSPKLKPCPFCGADSAVLRQRGEWHFWVVWCQRCNAEVEAPLKDIAIANWNRRASAIDTEALRKIADLAHDGGHRFTPQFVIRGRYLPECWTCDASRDDPIHDVGRVLRCPEEASE